MRILLVNDRPPGSRFGAEIHLAHLITGLRSAGVDVEVFSGEPRSGLQRVLDVWDPSARKAVARLETTFRPDVTHFHNVVRELSSSVFSAPVHSARVLTLHDFRLLGSPDGPIGAPFDAQPIRAIKMLKARAERIVAKRAVDALIAPNETVAAWLRARGFEEIHVVPQFVPHGPEPTRKPSSSRSVLFAGRLADDKGLQVLIPAFARVVERVPDATLVVAGDGPDRDRLGSMARAMLGDRVKLLGMISSADLRREMERARVVVVPSMMLEAGPLVAIEAAFAGRPVVGSDAPGLNELTGLGTFGRIVPRGQVGPLADALGSLLEDPVESDKLGAEARKVALATWTIDEGVGKTLAVYERAIEIARSRRALTTET